MCPQKESISTESIFPLGWTWRRGTLFPVDYRNGRTDVSLDLPLLFSPYSQFRPVLPWQQGLVRHEDYGREKKDGKSGRHESTCSPIPAAENLMGIYGRDGETRVSNFLSYTNMFVLQHEHFFSSSIQTSLLPPLCPFLLFFLNLTTPYIYPFHYIPIPVYILSSLPSS